MRELPEQPRSQPGRAETLDLYESPNSEQQKLNRIYRVIQECYRQTMFDAPPRWVGYSSGLGFDLPRGTFEYAEPSLQRILSFLHLDLSEKKVGLEEAKKKLQIVVDALEKFDPEKDIDERFRNEFYETNAQDHIRKVKEAIKNVLTEISQ